MTARDACPEDMHSAVIDVTSGALYYRLVPESDTGGLKRVGPYKVLGVATHTENNQEMIVYTNAVTNGLWWLATPAWFFGNFEPLQSTKAAIEKVAGRKSTGNPW